MSIYATLWTLQFPATGDDLIGCDWVEVTAQGVPPHIGTPTPGHGYEGGDRCSGTARDAARAIGVEELRDSRGVQGAQHFGAAAGPERPQLGRVQRDDAEEVDALTTGPYERRDRAVVGRVPPRVEAEARELWTVAARRVARELHDVSLPQEGSLGVGEAGE